MWLFLLLTVAAAKQATVCTDPVDNRDECHNLPVPCHWKEVTEFDWKKLTNVVSHVCEDCAVGACHLQFSKRCCGEGCFWLDEACHPVGAIAPHCADPSSSCSDLEHHGCSALECNLIKNQGGCQFTSGCVPCPQADAECSERLSRSCCYANVDCVWKSGVCVSAPPYCDFRTQCSDIGPPCTAEDCNGSTIVHQHRGLTHCQWDIHEEIGVQCQPCPELGSCLDMLSENCCLMPDNPERRCQWVDGSCSDVIKTSVDTHS